MQNTELKNSCWNCFYHDVDNETFFGRCNYFKTKGLPAKEVPPEIVDKGCKLYQPKQS